MKEYILFFDSGLGGLNILNESLKYYPHQNYIYFVENKFAPLGNRTRQDILNIVIHDIKQCLLKYKIKLVVLACNTATSIAIKELRRQIPSINFVGVEPAILPALKSGYKNILIMSTYATFKYNKLLQQLKYSGVIFFKSKHFAHIIDENIDNLNKIRPQIYKELKKYANMHIGAVVLGCTHYSFIKEEIQNVLGKDIAFFEPYIGVIKKIDYLLKETKMLNQKIKGDIIIILSKKNIPFKKTIKKIIKNPT